jgi:type VI secretion system secreted protein Hcp
MKRIGKAALLLAVGAAGAGAALAAASVPGSNGVISACVSVTTNTAGVEVPVTTTAGNVEIIDTAADETCSAPVTDGGRTGPGQTTLQWSATGPQGPAGTPGTPGTPGAIGKTLTIADGNTLTLPNREVITVGGSEITAPVVNGGRSLGKVTLSTLKQGSVKNAGKSQTTFSITGFQFGLQTPVGSSTGSASGKRQHGTVTITKEVDSASPLLLKALFDNEALKTVKIVIAHGGGGKSETIELTNVFVAAVGRPPTGAGESQTETLTLDYEKVEFAFSK